MVGRRCVAAPIKSSLPNVITRYASVNESVHQRVDALPRLITPLLSRPRKCGEIRGGIFHSTATSTPAIVFILFILSPILILPPERVESFFFSPTSIHARSVHNGRFELPLAVDPV